MKLDIPSPAECAEANRIKDEARRLQEERYDDSWLEKWTQGAVVRLVEYRGEPITLPIKSMTLDDGKWSRDVFSVDRFVGKVAERFGEHGWRCRPVNEWKICEGTPVCIEFDREPEDVDPAHPGKRTFWQRLADLIGDGDP